MDETINRAILYGVRPPKGIHFTVRVEYNHEHPVYGGQMEPGEFLMSNPIKSFPEAMHASEQIAKQLQKEKFRDSQIIEVDPDETEGYHYYIQDHQHEPLARVGIDTHDYRNETFH